MRIARFSALLIALACLSLPAARAQQSASGTADSEELGGQMLGDIDALVGQVMQKLNSSKPLTSKDLDSVFNDKFFSGDGDPFATLEQLEKKMGEQTGPVKAQFGESYKKWAAERLDAQDLEPVTRDAGSEIVMDFKAPPGAEGSLNLDINKSRIMMKYASKDVRELKRSDGTPYTTSFIKRHVKLISLPKGADPARYKVAKNGQGLRITFKKKSGGNKAEASK